ncbi:MAG: nuclear transport factor 2 family protein [Solirubrobacterales bacterium]
MADMVPAVCRILDQIEARDWDELERLLAHDVHWTTAIEDELHGPQAVIEAFKRDPPPAPPSWHELRDGQITRWIDCPG